MQSVRDWSLGGKLTLVGVPFLALALLAVTLTLWVSWQLAGGAAAVNEAGRLRMQTWRLTSAVQAQRPTAEVQALVILSISLEVKPGC